MKHYLFALTCRGDRSLDCSAATTNHTFAATWDARSSICLSRLNDNRSKRKDEGNQMHYALNAVEAGFWPSRATMDGSQCPFFIAGYCEHTGALIINTAARDCEHVFL